MAEYFVKSMFCFLVLYLSYIGFFRNSRNYEINRIVLLLSVFFSLVVPALKIAPDALEISATGQDVSLLRVLSYQSDIPISEPFKTVVGQGSFIDLLQAFYAIYLVICVLLLARFAFNLCILILTAHRSEKIVFKGIKLTLSDQHVSPFTFFNTIFISRATYQEGRTEEELILHELAHKNQLHSLDVVIMELAQIFFWINPFVYLFKRLMKANHEYLADDFVLKSGISYSVYCHKLINYTSGRRTMGLGSGFNYVFMKNRLIMLSRYNQHKRPAYQVGFFVPIFSLLFFTTGFTATESFLGTTISLQKEMSHANTLFQAKAQDILLEKTIKEKSGKDNTKEIPSAVDDARPTPNSSIALNNTESNTEAYKQEGEFYADEIFWSAETKEILLKGNMKVKFGQNDFTLDGTFSGFDKGSLLIVDGDIPNPNSSINISGKKCTVVILTVDEATAKYGVEGKHGAVEVTSSE